MLKRVIAVLAPVLAGALALSGGTAKAEEALISFKVLSPAVALELAQALGVGQRDRVEEHGVGGLGAGRLGPGQEVVEQVEGFGVSGHGAVMG